MRVKDCEKCEYCQRRTYSTYYEPTNYHPIGMTHAFAYCSFHQRKVRDVKKCVKLPQGHAS